MSIKFINGGLATLFPLPTTVIDENFDSGTLANSIADITNIGTAVNAVFDNTRSVSGSQSAKCSITAGNTNWGYIYALPTALFDTDTIRCTFDVFYPTGFDFDAAPNVLKFIRFKQETSASVHVGYIDLYIDLTNNRFATIVEGVTTPTWTYLNNMPVPTTNVWHKYAFEARLGATSTDSGGDGRMMVYHDDFIEATITDLPTLDVSTNKIVSVYIFSFWNNTAPATQSCWVDNFKVETS